MNGTLLPPATDATFSPCRRYRYRLWRVWDPDAPRALFVMMNPSTADEVKNDPTVERCQRRAIAWNASGRHVIGGVEVVNVFAWRETDSKLLPKLIAQGVDIVGPENDRHIVEAARTAAIVVCAWGNPGNLLGRGSAVLELLRKAGVQPHALVRNADGTPGHPLYVGYDVMPFRML